MKKLIKDLEDDGYKIIYFITEEVEIDYNLSARKIAVFVDECKDIKCNAISEIIKRNTEIRVFKYKIRDEEIGWGFF